MRNEVIISILTYNKLDYTKKCLEKIFENTILPYHRIVVTDNGSSDDTVKYLRSLDNRIRLIENKENLGFSKAHNNIIDEYPFHDIVLMNNDIEVPFNWLRILNEQAYSNDYGVVTPAIVQNGKLDVGAVLDSSAKGRSLVDDFKTEPDWVTGSCFYMTRNAISSVGLLDNNFEFYYEDVDYCVRMKKIGIKFKCIKGVQVVHHNSVSSTPDKKREMMEKSREYFIRKHSWGKR